MDEHAVRSVLEPSAHRATPSDDASRVADLIATNMAQVRTLSAADLARADALVRAVAKGTDDKPAIDSPRRSSPPRRGTKRTMRDVVPGLRYSDAIPVRGH